jgi:hypothetical protein
MHPLSSGNNLDSRRGMRSWDFYGVFSAPGAVRDVLKLIDLIGAPGNLYCLEAHLGEIGWCD